MTGSSTSIQLYRPMRLIRRFEEEVRKLVNANEIARVSHGYIGQEAVAAGVCAASQMQIYSRAPTGATDTSWHVVPTSTR